MGCSASGMKMECCSSAFIAGAPGICFGLSYGILSNGRTQPYDIKRVERPPPFVPTGVGPKGPLGGDFPSGMGPGAVRLYSYRYKRVVVGISEGTLIPS